MGQADECTRGFQFALGVTREGRVCIDFCGQKIGILEMTPDQALNLAEGLVETATDAARGIQIPTPGIVAMGRH